MKANTRGTTWLKKPEKASAVITNNCSPKNISESSSLNFSTCFQTAKAHPWLSRPPHCKAPSPSFRDAHPQKSDGITKPNLVRDFPTPQFPISLMGIIAGAHFPSWRAGALQKHLDAMETGDIPPPTLPQASSVIQQKCRWTSSWSRGNLLLLLDEGRATFGQPLLPTLFCECEQPLSGFCSLGTLPSP